MICYPFKADNFLQSLPGELHQNVGLSQHSKELLLCHWDLPQQSSTANCSQIKKFLFLFLKNLFLFAFVHPTRVKHSRPVQLREMPRCHLRWPKIFQMCFQYHWPKIFQMCFQYHWPKMFKLCYQCINHLTSQSSKFCDKGLGLVKLKRPCGPLVFNRSRGK